MFEPEHVIASPLLSIGFRLVAACLAIVCVVAFTEMTIRVRHHVPANPPAAAAR
jgi:hypothetical protein